MTLQDRLKKKFKYSNGFLYHLDGDRLAGWKDKDGYLLISFEGKTWRYHRLMYIYHNGDIESEVEVDHKNGDRTDMRPGNLRPATRTQNNQNRSMHSDNKSGFKGVVETLAGFTAYAKKDGKTVYLGSFKTAEEASDEYVKFNKEHHKEFFKTVD